MSLFFQPGVPKCASDVMQTKYNLIEVRFRKIYIYILLYCSNSSRIYRKHLLIYLLLYIDIFEQ